MSFIDDLRARLGADPEIKGEAVRRIEEALIGDSIESGGNAAAAPEHIADPRVAALVRQGVPAHQAEAVAHRVRGENLREILADAKELSEDLGYGPQRLVDPTQARGEGRKFYLSEDERKRDEFKQAMFPMTTKYWSPQAREGYWNEINGQGYPPAGN